MAVISELRAIPSTYRPVGFVLIISLSSHAMVMPYSLTTPMYAPQLSHNSDALFTNHPYVHPRITLISVRKGAAVACRLDGGQQPTVQVVVIWVSPFWTESTVPKAWTEWR